MTVKIRQSPYERDSGPNAGPYPVHSDLVRAQLGVIAMAGSPDLPVDLGEDDDPADSNYTIVTYDPGPQDSTIAPGRVRQLLSDLVNQPGDVILFGVGPDFVWSDGSTIDASAGAAIGNWIFYDTHNCDGSGRWVRGTDGNEVCTTSAGILFHELGHVSLDHPQGTVDEDEQAAVVVENDLRSAEGLVSRDPANWPESDCGCPNGCCIVASVASGSPFSSEVHDLRRLRDGILRTTDFGKHLFDAIHREYYSFSVAICRVMVGSDKARGDVSHWLVQPLVRSLGLIRQYTERPDQGDVLGEAICNDEADGLVFKSGSWRRWTMAADLLQQVSSGDDSLPGPAPIDRDTREIFAILARSLPECPHVQWGIIEPLIHYASARAAAAKGDSAVEVGRQFEEAIDDWAARVPLTYIEQLMSPQELAGELQELGETLFASSRARGQFAHRFLDESDTDDRRELTRRLREAGYLE